MNNEPIYTNRLFWLQIRLAMYNERITTASKESIRVMQQAMDCIECELLNLNK